MDWTRVVRVTSPSATIVSVDEAKAHLRITHPDDDAYILQLIKAATGFIEGPTGAGIAVIQSQWRLSLDELPAAIDIDLCPVVTVDTITVEGVALATSTYSTDLDSTPARIAITTPRANVGLGKVKVLFTAGYVTVPADLKQAALLLIGHLYENREASTAGGEVKEVPFAVKAILAALMHQGVSER